MDAQFVKQTMCDLPYRRYEYWLVPTKEETDKILEEFKGSGKLLVLGEPHQIEYVYTPATVQVNVYPTKVKPISDDEFKEIWECANGKCETNGGLNLELDLKAGGYVSNPERCPDLELKNPFKDECKDI